MTAFLLLLFVALIFTAIGSFTGTDVLTHFGIVLLIVAGAALILATALAAVILLAVAAW
jgi:hypothetical protein